MEIKVLVAGVRGFFTHSPAPKEPFADQSYLDKGRDR